MTPWLEPLAIASLLLLTAKPVAAPTADPFASWAPLLGHWTADPMPATPGVNGEFTFERDLESKILVRRNRADYPASKDRLAQHHEDLMVIFVEGAKTRADYFDNEGHVIRYTAAFETPTKLVLLSEVLPGAPRFRLVYGWTQPDRITIGFDIAPPGQPEAFKPYISATAHRSPGP